MAQTVNPISKKIGFSHRDRIVVIHPEDIGTYQAGVEAFADLHRVGIVSSGAVMVPCPWFLHAVAFARENPKADIGIRRTLTSEWKIYCWGPVSTRDPASGMMDGAGFFHYKCAQVREQRPFTADSSSGGGPLPPRTRVARLTTQHP